MRLKYIRLTALTMIIGGLLIIFVWAHKSVTLSVNGKKRTYDTFSLKTRSFLAQIGISVNKNDRVQPALDHWLSDGEIIQIEYASQIYIQADGETHLFFSAERLPANILNSAGIFLFPGDSLMVDGLPATPDEPLSIRPNHSLQVFRSTPITLHEGNNSQVTYTSAKTVGEALWSAGIRLHENDTLDPSFQTRISAYTNVTIQPSKELEIRFNGGDLHFRTSASTVGSALTQAGISLQGLDYSQPPATESLPSNGIIQIVRVNENISLETEPIPFDTQTQPLPDLELDHTRLIQAGSYGQSAHRVRVRLDDGKEVARQTEGDYIVTKPESRIVGYGTKIVPHTAQTPDGTIKYWRSLEMYAVSYNPTSAGGTITASGVPLSKGIAAIDTNYIPFGTRLYIPGYGEAVAADRGGGVKGRIIDLGYSDADYVSWHQWTTVYFLWPPPDQVVWIIP